MQTTLYEYLGAPVIGQEAGRSERTADDGETVDRDRFLTLYQELCSTMSALGEDLGRTEITRDDTETVDRDRMSGRVPAALLAPARDLYAALAS